MKVLLSLVGFTLLGALIIVIIVHAAALALGVLVVAGRRDNPFLGGRARTTLGRCAGVATGSALAGLAPFGLLLAPACSLLGLRLLLPLTWRQACLVVLASTSIGMIVGWMV